MKLSSLRVEVQFACTHTMTIKSSKMTNMTNDDQMDKREIKIELLRNILPRWRLSQQVRRYLGKSTLPYFYIKNNSFFHEVGKSTNNEHMFTVH